MAKFIKLTNSQPYSIDGRPLKVVDETRTAKEGIMRDLLFNFRVRMLLRFLHKKQSSIILRIYDVGKDEYCLYRRSGQYLFDSFLIEGGPKIWADEDFIKRYSVHSHIALFKGIDNAKKALHKYRYDEVIEWLHKRREIKRQKEINKILLKL